MDHMRKSEELLIEVAGVRDALKAMHHSGTGRERIASAYDELRHLTAMAKIHATLAVAQATYDAASLREVIDSRAAARPTVSRCQVTHTGPPCVGECEHRLDDSGKGLDE